MLKSGVKDAKSKDNNFNMHVKELEASLLLLDGETERVLRIEGKYI